LRRIIDANVECAAGIRLVMHDAQGL
jgi:hypothetical protein